MPRVQSSPFRSSPLHQRHPFRLARRTDPLVVRLAHQRLERTFRDGRGICRVYGSSCPRMPGGRRPAPAAVVIYRGIAGANSSRRYVYDHWDMFFTWRQPGGLEIRQERPVLTTDSSLAKLPRNAQTHTVILLLDVRDTVDFHQGMIGDSGNGNRAPDRRLGSEAALVNFVHPLVILQVGQVHRDLEHLLHGRAGTL